MERLRAGTLAHRRIGRATDRLVTTDAIRRVLLIGLIVVALLLFAQIIGCPTGARSRKMNVLVLLLAAGVVAHGVLGWLQKVVGPNWARWVTVCADASVSVSSSKVGRKPCYTLTPQGRRVALFLKKVQARILRSGLQALDLHITSESPPPLRSAHEPYTFVQTCLSQDK